MARLSRTASPGPLVRQPAYDPEAHGAGILHIGIGAFHKAHQAVYTDDALAAAGGDWRIVGVSLRSREAAEALNPQDGRYLLVTRNEAADTARLIGSIERVLVAPDAPDAVIEAIASPSIRVVTVTVTEKAYGLNRETGGLDLAHDAIAHDLENPHAPTGVIGFIVAGLSRRRMRGQRGLTIVCCDNLPENGRLLARLVDDFAGRIDPTLAKWIDREVSFPSSMVDRITPSSTERTLADARHLSGHADAAVVETEPFSQWVIEDDFIAGRPAWESGGALFVKDVAPYEQMKLRLLNGTHSLLAYAGFLAGHETIAEAVRNPHLGALAERQMAGAAATLPPIPGIDLAAYRKQLLDRFGNRAIRHLTYQIAMDGTQKLPQRILSPLHETLRQGGDAGGFCFAIAAWMRYCIGETDDGNIYPLRDPLEDVIKATLADARHDAAAIFDGLSVLPGVFDPLVATDPFIRQTVVSHLELMLELGMTRAIAGAS
jgi:fructuronate reductase